MKACTYRIGSRRHQLNAVYVLINRQLHESNYVTKPIRVDALVEALMQATPRGAA